MKLHKETMFSGIGKGETEKSPRTIIYMVNLHFALHGGIQHNLLNTPGLNC